MTGAPVALYDPKLLADIWLWTFLAIGPIFCLNDIPLILTGGATMLVRTPAVAGRFYDDTNDGCRTHIQSLLESRQNDLPKALPSRIVAGIVPHAGWVFSGDLAGMVFQAIKQVQASETFIVLGAVHRHGVTTASIYDSGSWQTPMGSIKIDEQLAAQILDHAGEYIHSDPKCHNYEHSIEVQIPFIQYLFPQAAILPIMVPANEQAADLGPMLYDIVEKCEKNVVVIASTDLTHYGPSYYHTPMGTGAEGIKWAKSVNDKYFIQMALDMKCDMLVGSAQTYNNACGAGAAAAAVAYARAAGISRGQLLAHTTSDEVMRRVYRQSSSDSVGYAALIYGN